MAAPEHPNPGSRALGALVPALFFLSGAAGLLYQVIWVRQFGNLFGNTVASASVVTAVFLGGLGLGSYALGRLADRRTARDASWPLRAYTACELGIALSAEATRAVLPHLEGVAASVSSYTVDADGFHVLTAGSMLARDLIGAALIAPATFLMGGTLAILSRRAVGEAIGRAGWSIGLLYGVNTLGAALGALLSDSMLIPLLGLDATTQLATGLNLLCAAGARVLSLFELNAAKEEPAIAAPPAPAPSTRRAMTLAAVALALSGYAAMGFEILWFRQLGSSYGELRSVFSMLLAVVLGGLFLGAIGGGWIARRGRSATAFLALQGTFVAAALVELARTDRDALVDAVQAHHAALAAASAATQQLELRGMLAWAIVAAVGLPSLLMGFAFPLANAHAQRVSAEVGAQVGRLYLATALGNVLGALTTGLFWLPALGMQRSASVLAAVAATALVPMFLSARASPGPRETPRSIGQALIAGMALASLGLIGFALLPRGYLLRDLVHERPGDRVIAVSEGEEETLAVVEWGATRTLMTNGHAMSGTTRGAQRYMRAFAHLPLLQIDQPRRALVICFGVGNTTHAASLNLLERIDVVDVSRNVLAHASDFATWNHRILSNGIVQTFVNDGRHHLRMQPEGTYDLITLEPPPITQAGVNALYSEEFYQLARSRLTAGGFLTQWLPAYQVRPEVARSMIRAFLDVFPDAVLLSGASSELMLMGRAGAPITLDLDQLERNLQRRPMAALDLASVGMGSLTELAGTFLASADAMRAATASSAPITDDVPAMEASQVTLLTVNRLGVPVALDGIRAWCPACFDAAGRPTPRVPDLDRYLAALDTYYRSDAFLDFSNDPSAATPTAPKVPPPLQSTVDAHVYLRELFAAPSP